MIEVLLVIARMLQVNIIILKISAERFLVNIPAQMIQVGVNMSLFGVENKREGGFEVSFLLSVNYSPPVGSINIQGRAIITGTNKEVEKVYSEYELHGGPPQAIAQAISNAAFVEAIAASRSLGIPPPIPLLYEAEHKSKVDYRI